MAAYSSESGWVRHGDDLISPRRIKKLKYDDMDEPATNIKNLVVPKKEWIEISAETGIMDAKEWVRTRRRANQGGTTFGDDAVLIMVNEDEVAVAGVLEIGDLM